MFFQITNEPVGLPNTNAEPSLVWYRLDGFQATKAGKSIDRQFIGSAQHTSSCRIGEWQFSIILMGSIRPFTKSDIL
jgi:hypothetical protein